MFLKRLGLQGKLILYGAIGLVLLLAILFRFSYNAIDLSSNALLDERMMLARSMAEEIELPLQHAAHAMLEVADDLAASPSIDAEAYRWAVEQLYRHFVNYHHFKVLGMAALSPRGDVLYSMTTLESASTENYLRGLDIRRIVETRAPVLSTFSFQTREAHFPGVFVAAPVAKSGGEVEAIIAAVIDPVHPSVALGTVAKLSSERFLVEIVDHEGWVVAASRPERAGKITEHLDIVQSMALRETSGAAVHNEPKEQEEQGGADHVVAFSRLPTLDWILVIEQREDVALALPKRLTREMLLLSAFGIFVFSGLAWLVSRQIVMPLGSLTAAAKRIAGGDLGAAVPTKGGDELGVLADSFEQMRVRLLVAQEELRRWTGELEDRVEQRTRELTALFEASRAMTSILDQPALLDVFIAKVKEVFPQADVVVLLVWDESSKRLVVKGGYGFDLAELPAHLEWEATIAGQVSQSNRSTAYHGAEMIAAFDEPFLASVLGDSRRPCCALGVSLHTQERSFGSLVLYTFDPDLCPTEHDLRVLQTLADQVAVSMDNARLFEEAKQIRALRELDAMKSEFVAWASHELRTPLASIKSLAETLLREDLALSPEDQRMFLESIDSSSDRLARIMDNLLTLSRIEAGKMEMKLAALPVGRAIRRVVQQFRTQYPRTISIDVPPRAPLVLADQDLLDEVLSNLLSNAVKYSPPESGIRIEARMASRLKDMPVKEGRPPLVVISITDEGIGIPSEQIGQLFQRFYRVSHPTEGRVTGVGLGLYISKAYVEAMGGQMWVESRLNQGSSFFFTLPSARANAGLRERPSRRARNGASAAEKSKLAILKDKHVVIVDDEPQVVRTLQLNLEASGIHVRAASSGQECLTLVRQSKPDAIVMDVVMPGMSGLEVLYELQHDPATQEIPVILISARSQEEDVATGMAAGAKAYVGKPFSALHIRDLLADTLERETVVTARS